MDLSVIERTIGDLKALGVFWIGLTGGEPLLNKNLARIIETAREDCAVKLFTTGHGLTKERAAELTNAGLFSVSISLDHWDEAEHDRIRHYQGAYKSALEAIKIFIARDKVHVSVSAVLSRDMLKEDFVERYLDFLEGLGVHEAWLSETKPTLSEFWREDAVIADREHAMLAAIQDRRNKKGGMTVNYLGHFEDERHFGCTAGHKMIYVDSFGEVSPCVFIPLTFGNVQEKSIRDIYDVLKSRFTPDERCFINKNYPILRKYFRGEFPFSPEDSMNVLADTRFGGSPRFFQLQYRQPTH